MVPTPDSISTSRQIFPNSGPFCHNTTQAIRKQGERQFLNSRDNQFREIMIAEKNTRQYHHGQGDHIDKGIAYP